MASVWQRSLGVDGLLPLEKSPKLEQLLGLAKVNSDIGIDILPWQNVKARVDVDFSAL